MAMKASTRRKVSYVVQQKDEERAHCLGVNSLALHTPPGSSGVLYSAGRDGVVAGWDLHMPITDRHDKGWVLDETLESAPRATSKVFSQMHTDWVNDIVVCQGGESVVSASSDRTVKLWRPYSDTPNTAHTIGLHSDYAKCLVYASEVGWVASGGLDKKINVWDLERGVASLTISTGPRSLHTNSSDNLAHHDESKSSIYAMATTPTGSLFVTGSPEKVVRLWDPRTGNRISKLTGHTDNIRALLVSDDGEQILSGSSDSTIKLWSVRAQRCLATYETHSDSVWSLYSNRSDLQTFYAGSRDGLVTKTEVSAGSFSDASESECIALFKESSGVVKIVALDDTYIWTATSSASVNRWLSVPSRDARFEGQRTEFDPEILQSSIFKIPSKMNFTQPDPYVMGDNLTLYAGSVMSIPLSIQEDDTDSTDSVIPLRSEPNSVIKGKPGITSHCVLNNRRHVLTQDTNGEVALWDLVKCTQIKRFGKQKLDRVAQEINNVESFPAWCSVDTKIGAITVQLHEPSCFDCEMYADEAELPPDYTITEDQRINLGKWVLMRLFEHFIVAELEKQKQGINRYQENDGEPRLANEDPKPAKDGLVPSEAANTTTSTSTATATNTTNTSTTAAVTASPSNSTVPDAVHESLHVAESLRLPLAAITTDFNSTFHAQPHDNSLHGPFTAPPSTTGHQLSDYFSESHHPARRDSSVQLPAPVVLSHSPASPTNSNFMHRLKSLSAKAKLARVPTHEENTKQDTHLGGVSEQDEDENKDKDKDNEKKETTPVLTSSTSTTTTTTNTTTSTATTTATPKTSTEDSKKEERPKGGVAQPETLAAVPENVTYTPPPSADYPPLSLPGQTTIVIAEESAEASTGMDLYRGTLATTGIEADSVLKAAPSWLLSFLLFNKTPTRETVKLTFVLKPLENSNTAELPGGSNNRLLANRVLRVRKLAQYIAEKLNVNVETHSIVLACGETVLGPTMTLATIKQHILKSNGDIPLTYSVQPVPGSTASTNV
ncbi:WD40-repeat-containing domain protein [Phycomyces blakesleeanus]|uniref:WD40-repeat-containing domain protein n=2 Tax=Phycomyces blakesleeanus TaxID=4837 RepID=A0ABR3B800_PHYBL